MGEKDNTTKKILGLLSTIGLFSTTSVNVVAFGDGVTCNDDGSGSIKPETPFNIKGYILKKET